MSKQANETFAEAVAAERDHIKKAQADSEDLEIECVFTDEEVVAVIDRLESAHKREVAELRELLNNVAKACDAEEARLPVGGNIDTRLWLEAIIGRIRQASVGAVPRKMTPESSITQVLVAALKSVVGCYDTIGTDPDSGEDYGTIKESAYAEAKKALEMMEAKK